VPKSEKAKRVGETVPLDPHQLRRHIQLLPRLRHQLWLQQPRRLRPRNQHGFGPRGFSAAADPLEDWVGGRLSVFQSAWRRLTCPKWTRSIIEEGFRIPFFSIPPVSTHKSASYPLSQAAQLAMEQEISKLLVKRAIEEVSMEEVGHRSPLFVIPKSNGQLRPVLNLRQVNSHIPRQPFKMESLLQVCRMLRSKDWLTSIDLTDAFLHILIHKASRRYFQFDWGGHWYQFRCLPFGLSLSPRIFTKILRPVIRWARAQGIRLSPYLDDILLAAASKVQAAAQTLKFRTKLESMGWLVNLSKSVLEPTQVIKHLGFYINTRRMTLTLPKDKVRDLRREAYKLMVSTSVPLRRLASFIGKAQAAVLAVLPARLQNETSPSVQGLRLGSRYQLDSTSHSDSRSTNGLAMVERSSPVLDRTVIPPTDPGVGCIHGRFGLGFWDYYSPRDPLRSVVSLGKRPFYQVERTEDNPPRGTTSTGNRQDSQRTLGQQNHVGLCDEVRGHRSSPLMDLARQIWDFCLATDTRIMTSFIKSEENPADLPSRNLGCRRSGG